MAYFKKSAGSTVTLQLTEEPVSNKTEYTDMYTSVMPDEVAYYGAFFTKALHTGSRVTCDPPILDTDDDWILLVPPELMDPFESILSNSAFQKGGSEDLASKDKSAFRSWKKEDADGTMNLILTTSEAFLEKSAKATWLSKKLNLKEKADRIAVFRAIREDTFEDIPEKKNFRHKSKKYFDREIDALLQANAQGAVQAINLAQGQIHFIEGINQHIMWGARQNAQNWGNEAQAIPAALD